MANGQYGPQNHQNDDKSSNLATIGHSYLKIRIIPQSTEINKLEIKRIFSLNSKNIYFFRKPNLVNLFFLIGKYWCYKEY